MSDLDYQYEGENEEQVLFWGGKYNCFSNFSAYQIEFEGEVYPTSEHAYQAAKFSDKVVKQQIQQARSAQEAFHLGQQPGRRDDWQDVKVSIMESILRNKLDQHSFIQKKLIATGDRQIIEASPVDSFWGWGPHQDGENMLGKIWMKLRDELI
jgi:hypothetical protein